ncbi:MAG: hypothetical protein Q8P92_01415 [Candidatus Daviesbacteria bacterium]|nr:hypothetical protein [Candidatus Daviesbacteria bacterium]
MSSPIPEISTPEATVFYAWKGNSDTSQTDVTDVTVVRCRVDNDPKPLNFDMWTVSSTGTVSVLEIKEIEKSEIPYHWINKIPDVLENDAPQWVKDVIEEKLNLLRKIKK